MAQTEKNEKHQHIRKEWMGETEKKNGTVGEVDRSRVGLVTNTHLPSADLRRTSAVIGGYLLDKLKRRRRRHKLSQVWRLHVGQVQASPSSFINHLYHLTILISLTKKSNHGGDINENAH